jgi:hypothetical protein
LTIYNISIGIVKEFPVTINEAKGVPIVDICGNGAVVGNVDQESSFAVKFLDPKTRTVIEAGG